MPGTVPTSNKCRLTRRHFARRRRSWVRAQVGHNSRVPVSRFGVRQSRNRDTPEFACRRYSVGPMNPGSTESQSGRRRGCRTPFRAAGRWQSCQIVLALAYFTAALLDTPARPGRIRVIRRTRKIRRPE